MFNFMRRRTSNHYGWFSFQISSKNEFILLQNHPFSSSSSRKKTLKSTDNFLKNQPFTVRYLMKSCGLSQERALSASKKVHFETPEKPDSVLAFLRNQGFSAAQVSVVIRKYPRLLVCNPEKFLSPKFKFFESLGFSRPEITQLLAKSQNLLIANMETQVIPYYNTLTSFFSSPDETVFCIKRYPDLLARNFQTRVEDNINIFREAGVAESRILTLLKRQPRAFLTSPDKIKESVEELKKMEFNPFQSHFLTGAYVKIAINKSVWDKKIELFKTWGISEDEVKAGFRVNPWCMAASEEQIQNIMEFFVHKMEFDPLEVIKKPILISLSLKKTILPRYSVYQVLLSKGLVKDKIKISVFNYAKHHFFEKFVKCHSRTAPELLKLIQGTS